MRKPFVVVTLLAVVSLAVVAADKPAGKATADRPAVAPPASPSGVPLVRELYIPYEDLHALLENEPRRVLLTPEEYADLLKKARPAPADRPSRSALAASAEYVAQLEPERAVLVATLDIEVLADGLHVVDLGLPATGLRRAMLDGRPAALGCADDRLQLFVAGRGHHALVLELVAPVRTTAALQTLELTAPATAAGRIRLSVPGNIEVRSGAAVVARNFDAARQSTSFELLAPPGPLAIALTINDRRLQAEAVVLSRSAQVAELTGSYERLHATISLAMPRRPVQEFRFAVPAGFDVTHVATPLLASWTVDESAAADGGAAQRVLTVRLREPAAEPVVLTVAALRTLPLEQSPTSEQSPSGSEGHGVPSSPPIAWTMPVLRPLDVESDAGVLGLLLEERLRLTRLAAEHLIPIDTAVLTAALPATATQREPGAPGLRALAAFYAPAGVGPAVVTAAYERPARLLHVTGHLHLHIAEQQHELHGSFAIRPEYERLFHIELAAPAGWHVRSVTDAAGQPLPFEPAGAEQAGVDETPTAPRWIVRFPAGLAAGAEQQVLVHATRVPAGWLDAWTTQQVEFPRFHIAGADQDRGAVAVTPGEDLEIFPETLEGLVPLDEAERVRYGLQPGPAAALLSWQHPAAEYAAVLRVQRAAPRLTARSYAFFRLEPNLLAGHYELVYEVTGARVRELSFLLPADTPADVTLGALEGVAIKERRSALAGDQRLWTVTLAEPRRGTVRLTVDFDQKLEDATERELALPIAQADGVTYQSGLLALAGANEAEIELLEHPRRVDVGELAAAHYQAAVPTGAGLGAFEFVGPDPVLRVRLTRRPGYGVPPILVERAELYTALAAEGRAQTVVRFSLRSAVEAVLVALPAGASLWSVELDGQPARPQRDAGHVLIELAGAGPDKLRDLRIIYETPATPVALWGGLDLATVTLLLPPDDAHAAPRPVPVADVAWHLALPGGYRVLAGSGTLTGGALRPPEPAAWTVGRTIGRFTGGVNFLWGTLMPSLSRAREISKSAGRREYGDIFANVEAELPVDHGVVAKELSRTGPARPAAEPSAPQPPSGPPVAGGAGGRDAPQPVATKAPALKPASQAWSLEGLRSLPIELQRERTAAIVTFQGLAAAPHLRLDLAQWHRIRALAWTLAAAVALAGLAVLRRCAWTKARLIAAVLLVTTLVPLVSGRPELAHVTNLAFYTGCLLVPLYLFAAAVRWLLAHGGARLTPARAVTTLILLTVCVGAAADAPPQKAKSDKTAPAAPGRAAPSTEEARPPLKVPADAILVPYDPNTATYPPQPGPHGILVPYQKYVELLNLAQLATGQGPPPAPYALAGAAWEAVLGADDDLELTGTLDLEVYTADDVAIPLELGGGVVTRAELDGSPARLGLLPAAEPPGQGGQSQTGQGQLAFTPSVDRLALRVHGAGPHRLVLGVRLKVERQGGWRVAAGRVPAGPAGALTLRVPEPGTEVRLEGLFDRAAYETAAADQVIATSLGRDGALTLRWRPRVQEAQVEAGLTAASTAVLDVREDGLLLVWRISLDLGRAERDTFDLLAPAGYLLERVDGPNVRGWEVRSGAGAGPLDDGQRIEVTLLKAVGGTQVVTLIAHRTLDAATQAAPSFDVPAVRVVGAALQSGTLVIRRSPRLNLRTEAAEGLTRIDPPDDTAALAAAAGEARLSPLGIGPYQAYRFTTLPFTLRCTASRPADVPSASHQTVLRVGERQRSIETRINVQPAEAPVYQVQIELPADLRVERVAAPELVEWSVDEPAADSADARILTVLLGTGMSQGFAVLVRGALGAEGVVDAVPLPRIAVRGARRQSGEIAVQADPAFDVEPTGLDKCREIELRRVTGWLAAEQRELARLALQCTAADYAGVLRLVPRTPQVRCNTLTSVRVTETTIEETILLDFTVTRAGLRTLSFLLPAWLADARITVPMLRQKTVAPAAEGAEALLRVTLELQDDVMGQLRVLVEHDRLLADELQHAPLPQVETGQVERRTVLLESAGRDEVVVERHDGLEPLAQHQRERAELAALLGNDLGQAWLAIGDQPAFAYRTRARQAVQTAGARIGLARTVLMLAADGAYRAGVSYRVDNTTEQHLEVALPAGAELWSVLVAGRPVKPARLADPARAQHVRIPLVQTAPGDVDYEVLLAYGGTVPAPGALRTASFPVPRTINVVPALSQVELYLPDEYEWFDFGGTARHLEHRVALAEGQARYQTKLAERLTEAMRSGTDFAKARALANWAEVRGQMQVLQQSARGDVDGDGTAAAPAFDQNAAALERGEEAFVENANVVETQLEAAAQGNRYKFNDLYQGQRAGRARNLVQGKGDNYDWSLAGERKGTDFSREWLASNGLVIAGDASEQKDESIRAGLPVVTIDRKVAITKGAAAQSALEPPPPPQLAQAVPQSQNEPWQRRTASEEALNRYHQQLTQQQVPATQPQVLDSLGYVAGGQYALGFDAGGGPAAAASTRLDLRYGAPPAGTLASLPVRFPVRGRPHYFTTAGGDVVITARALSRTSILGWQHAAVVLAALVAGFVLLRLARAGRLAALSRGLGSSTVLILGVLSILSGILPGLGLLLVVLALAARIRGRFSAGGAA